ncbi:hypothetical protein MIR68_012163 [Amoeboaphelidium protococcarum]|nr:hypothetical protein MIR68_012163 [Amoeboaphelidium protococcarum]
MVQISKGSKPPSPLTYSNAANTQKTSALPVAVAQQKQQQQHQSDLQRTVKQLIAGGVAGFVSRTVVSPLERMKILFQVQTNSNIKYTGVVDTLRTVYREEGVKGYFKGNGTNCLRIIPYSAVQFATYERMKRLMMKNGETELDTSAKMISGAVSGCASVVTTYPLDLARTRLSVMTDMRTSDGNRMGIWRCLTQIFKSEGGFKGIYRGITPTAIGIIPYNALNFTVYESLKEHFGKRSGNKDQQVGVYQRLLFGGISGVIAQTVTYPVDVVRRRFQVMGMNNFGYVYSGTFQALYTMVKVEGLRSLYKGCIPNYLKVAPAISVSFVTYEYVKQLLEQTR